MPAAKRSKNPLPPNGEWRDGHPLWRPRPALRALGWRGHALRTADGEWMSQGQAVDRINEINAAVAAAKDGAPIPEWMVTFAPTSAAAAHSSAAATRRSLQGRTIGELIDTYLADPMPHGKPIKPKTVTHYRTYLAQFVATIAELRGVTPAAIRAQDISLLAVPEPGKGQINYAKEAYKRLHAAKGVNVSAATIVAAKAWFNWVLHTRNLLIANPCAGVKYAKPEGVIVVWEPHEVAALVDAAEWIGFTSVADAIILALDLTWSQADILALTWDQIDEHHRIYTKRVKTGVEGRPRAAAAGRARLDQIRERWTGPEHLRPLAVVVSEAGGDRLAWKPDYFRHAFSLVRDIASADVGPGILAKTFMDLRDTGITEAYRKKLTVQEVAARSLHSPASAVAIHARHYHLIDQDDQDDATAKLDAPTRRRRPRLAVV
jgi:hypothetical protein